MNRKQMLNAIENLSSPFASKMKKKGQFQVASQTIWAIVSFCLTIIVGLLVIGLLVGGGFFTSTSNEQQLLNNLSANVTAGLVQVIAKIPTVFTIIVAIVILSIVGLLVFIVAKFMGKSGGGANFGQ